VLDTGVDPDHPDLAPAIVAAESFVAGDARDRHGHGTHVAGVLAGRRPVMGPAYGVAPGARLHIGKVLDDDGRGTDAGVLDGIEWALEQGCRLVSLSLGSPWSGPGYPIAYEQAARTAIAAGSLLIAAAGNDSRRPDVLEPVNAPANAPSILAVAAVDHHDRVAAFSNPSFPGTGSVDVAAPGVAVRSAVPGGGQAAYDGTSMATPHVAGVAALLLEDRPSRSAWEVAARLHLDARRLTAASRDVGGGVAFAPRL
jgi:subtilisin family serine protease